MRIAASASMVTTPVTFIVGAGASKPYGLPLGKDLLRIARQATPSNELFQLLLAAGVNVTVLNNVLEDLRRHSAESIDEYMVTRRGKADVDKVCRLLIAGGLGIRLAELGDSHAPPAEEDWLAYVGAELRHGAGTFAECAGVNRVQFVTFNFDSVIEDRLARSLASFLDFDAARLAQVVPVHHVHGRLPAPPRLPITDNSAHLLFRREWLDWIHSAANSVNVIVDDIHADVLMQARSAISSAAIVCFLGFSYHSTNVQRLLPVTGTDRDVYGTTVGLEDGERARFRARLQPMGRANLDSQAMSCLKLLRSYQIFRD